MDRIASATFAKPTHRSHLNRRQAVRRSIHKLQASHESKRRSLAAQAAVRFLRAHAGDALHGSDRQSCAGASERLPQLSDAITGKQMPGPPDARFAFASLYALLFPDRFRSSAGGWEEMRTF